MTKVKFNIQRRAIHECSVSQLFSAAPPLVDRSTVHLLPCSQTLYQSSLNREYENERQNLNRPHSASVHALMRVRQGHAQMPQ